MVDVHLTVEIQDTTPEFSFYPETFESIFEEDVLSLQLCHASILNYKENHYSLSSRYDQIISTTTIFIAQRHISAKTKTLPSLLKPIYIYCLVHTYRRRVWGQL